MNRATMAWTLGLSFASASLLGCDQVKDACDIGCSEQGIAEGNASITGVKSLDGFFAAVIRFEQKAAQVSGGIDAELEALAADFGVDANELQASFGGDTAAAIQAQLAANFEGSVKVRAEPPRCDLDARAELSASAECQVEAGCNVDVDPGTAMLECKGSCEADVDTKIDCGANAELSCTFRGPAVACNAECKGTCTASFMVAARCDGSCKGSCMVTLTGGGSCDGKCNGTCSGSTDAAGRCTGMCTGECELQLSAGARCDGSCKGSCATEASAGAQCNGTCSGECTLRGAEASCMGAAEAHCEAMGNASVACSGKCEGDFEPPMAMAQCDASATCNAQAKADASVEVECSEPALDIDYALKAGLDASVAARMELGVRQLQVRLPRILARLQQARLLVDASAELGAAASGAAEGAVRAFGSGELGAVAALRVAECAPAQFQAVPGLIARGTAELKASVEAAGKLSSEVGL